MLKFVVLLAFVAAVTAVPAFLTVEPKVDDSADWRVVGGTNATAGAYPYMVSLRSSANAHFCGGSILNSQWILTAASCLVGRTVTNTMVVAGTNTLNAGGLSRNSSRFVIHANYDTFTFANDIAVIQLSQALNYSSLIAQVPLNTGNTTTVAAILLGWGSTVTNGSIPNNLQQLATNTIPHATCQFSWGQFVTTNQICAVTWAGQGACQGDGGGPLMQNSTRAQLGIVSFISAGGCALGYPDVYTRVSQYISWIQSAVSS
uniref:Serine protease 6 n=1 Tax=Costelytra zealandica TaxID=50579 RepID=B0ZBN4_9SCAR|nr:serine protease 6 [Costelytra zealandica]